LRDPISTHNLFYTLSLGYWNFNFRKRSNSSFGWLVTILCLPSLYWITAKGVILLNPSFIAFEILSSLVAFETTLVYQFRFLLQFECVRLTQAGCHRFSDSPFLGWCLVVLEKLQPDVSEQWDWILKSTLFQHSSYGRNL
jgi:hypothetical protein